MAELVYGIIKSFTWRGWRNVIVSCCFARCPFAITQKLDFLDL